MEGGGEGRGIPPSKSVYKLRSTGDITGIVLQLTTNGVWQRGIPYKRTPENLCKEEERTWQWGEGAVTPYTVTQEGFWPLSSVTSGGRRQVSQLLRKVHSFTPQLCARWKVTMKR